MQSCLASCHPELLLQALAIQCEYDRRQTHATAVLNQNHIALTEIDCCFVGSQTACAERHGEQEDQQPSAANSASGQEDDDESILADDPDETNAATQRLLRGALGAGSLT